MEKFIIVLGWFFLFIGFITLQLADPTIYKELPGYFFLFLNLFFAILLAILAFFCLVYTRQIVDFLKSDKKPS